MQRPSSITLSLLFGLLAWGRWRRQPQKAQFPLDHVSARVPSHWLPPIRHSFSSEQFDRGSLGLGLESDTLNDLHEPALVLILAAWLGRILRPLHGNLFPEFNPADPFTSRESYA